MPIGCVVTFLILTALHSRPFGVQCLAQTSTLDGAKVAKTVDAPRGCFPISSAMDCKRTILGAMIVNAPLHYVPHLSRDIWMW